MKILTLFAFILCLSSPVLAAEYEVDHGNSEVAFSGVHAGNEFNGMFEEWSAQITFDPNDLEASALNASFNPATAKTGNKLYDGTLPQDDWFDVKNHPQATYKSTSITVDDDGGHVANGDLTIRGITHPITFDFTLSDLSADTVSVNAEFPIDRLAYDIGKKSDAKAEWVSQDITITLNLKARPK